MGNLRSLPGQPNFLDELVAALTASVERSLAGRGKVTLLWSAGLDSSLVGWTGRVSSGLEALTIGVEGSHDLSKARQSHHLLELPWTERVLTREDVRKVRLAWHEELEDLKEPIRSVVVATILGLESSPRRTVVWGQGADELFLGYAHFGRLGSEAARARQRADTALLLDVEWPRAQRIAASLGHELRSPFLDPAVREAAGRWTIDEHLPGPETKPILRAVARRVGLPEPLASAPKKAWQYGSGIGPLVKVEFGR